MTPPLPDLVLYARAGCHLCDETREVLRALLAERTAQGRPTTCLLERDIDGDPELQRRFFTTIPVVELGDRRLELRHEPGEAASPARRGPGRGDAEDLTGDRPDQQTS